MLPVTSPLWHILLSIGQSCTINVLTNIVSNCHIISLVRSPDLLTCLGKCFYYHNITYYGLGSPNKVTTENFGFSDNDGDWKKCQCSRLSLYQMVFRKRRSFLGQKTVTVADCHCNRSSLFHEVTFSELDLRRSRNFGDKMSWAHFWPRERGSRRQGAPIDSPERRRAECCVDFSLKLCEFVNCDIMFGPRAAYFPVSL